MFYLREISYSFNELEYEFIKSIPANENGFTNNFHDSSLEDFLYKALAYYKRIRNGKNLLEGEVPATVFHLISDDEIVGQFVIRNCSLNNNSSESSHIRFYIAPQFRGKGFGKNGLRLAITYAYQLIDDEEIVFCISKTNEAAIKAVLANGGEISKEENGNVILKIVKKSVSKDFAMQIALDEAFNGIGNGDGGPFGCVITKDNKIIGLGHNRVLKNEDPTCHGEMEAIRDACRFLKTHDLSGCELYTTAEPCPMCLGGIMWANITKVYYGCNIQDTNDIGFRDEKFYDYLHGKKGLLEMENFKRQDCLELFKNYEKNKKIY